MKKYSLLYIALTAILATSCVEDEGNYTYTTLNEISIEGFESSYSKLAYIDNLQITPEITGSLSGEDLSNYEYQWHICSGSLGENIHSHTVISDEKDLDWPIQLTPGSYVVYFTVKEKSTGIETTTSTSLQVKNSFSTGFVLLGGIEGTSKVGLDMLTMAPDRDTIMVEGAFDDLYNGFTNPKKLFYSGYNNGSTVFMYLMTDDETWSLSMNDDNIFAPVETFTSQGLVECEANVKRPIRMLDTFPQGCVGIRTTLCSRARFYMAEDVILGGSAMITPVFFTRPYNHYANEPEGKLFNFYPYIFFTYVSSFSLYTPAGYLYDTDNDQFAQMSYYGYSCTAMTTPNVPWSFDCKSEGRKLMYGESGKMSGLSYMIMKGNDGKYYIYTITFPISNKALFPVDLNTATDFDKASHYSFSSARMTMFYSVGNTLYHYDYTTNKIHKIEMDGEITYMKAEYDSNRSIYELIVATWNESAKKGMIRKYDADKVPDDLSIVLRDNEEWETRLKIKDIAWFRK